MYTIMHPYTRMRSRALFQPAELRFVLILHPQETAEPVVSAGPDALLKEKTKQKRHRDGYEEGISTTARLASAASFLASEKPVEALGRFTRCRHSARSNCRKRAQQSSSPTP